jgi:hypothetical protein
MSLYKNIERFDFFKFIIYKILLIIIEHKKGLKKFSSGIHIYLGIIFYEIYFGVKVRTLWPNNELI